MFGLETFLRDSILLLGSGSNRWARDLPGERKLKYVESADGYDVSGEKARTDSRFESLDQIEKI